MHRSPARTPPGPQLQAKGHDLDTRPVTVLFVKRYSSTVEVPADLADDEVAGWLDSHHTAWCDENREELVEEVFESWSNQE